MAHAVTPAATAQTLARLESLADALAALGWQADLDEPPGRLPCLHVRNPEPGAFALSEHIYAQPRRDGTWAYWWPWAQAIDAPDPAGAAAVITRALRAQPAR
jgi:hypothetical protein